MTDEKEPSDLGMYNREGEYITVRTWISKGGGMMVHAAALDIDDPDHIYNQILDQGKIPEDYGFEHPYAQEFGECSRGQLIHEIVSLRKEVTALHRASAAGWI